MRAQAGFNATTCRVCGLMYAPGEASDERTHAAYHASYLRGITFQVRAIQGTQRERSRNLSPDLSVNPVQGSVEIQILSPKQYTPVMEVMEILFQPRSGFLRCDGSRLSSTIVRWWRINGDAR